MEKAHWCVSAAARTANIGGSWKINARYKFGLFLRLFFPEHHLFLFSVNKNQP